MPPPQGLDGGESFLGQLDLGLVGRDVIGAQLIIELLQSQAAGRLRNR